LSHFQNYQIQDEVYDTVAVIKYTYINSYGDAYLSFHLHEISYF